MKVLVLVVCMLWDMICVVVSLFMCWCKVQCLVWWISCLRLLWVMLMYLLKFCSVWFRFWVEKFVCVFGVRLWVLWRLVCGDWQGCGQGECIRLLQSSVQLISIRVESRIGQIMLMLSLFRDGLRVMFRVSVQFGGCRQCRVNISSMLRVMLIRVGVRLCLN